MKRIAMIIFALAAAGMTAQARLSETMEECEQRYDKHLSEMTDEWGFAVRKYKKNNVEVLVHFAKYGTNEVSRAVRVQYSDLGSPWVGAQLSAEYRLLFQANSEGHDWQSNSSKPIGRVYYYRADGGAYAEVHYSALVFVSRNYDVHIAEMKLAEEQARLRKEEEERQKAIQEAQRRLEGF